MNRWLIVIALLLGARAAGAGDAVRVFGYAYDLDNDRFLYTEVYEQTLSGGKVVASTVRYVMPDGTEFGRKAVDFSKDEFVPAYRLDLAREGYVEGIGHAPGAYTLTRQRPRGTPETETIAREGLLAADAGLLHLLQANFDILSAGETLNFRVIAASRLAAYKFRARRIDDTTFEGKPAARVQVEMDSMLKLFAGPLVFTFGEGHRLLEFRGPTNVRDPATGKDYKVRLAFYSSPPAGAAPR